METTDFDPEGTFFGWYLDADTWHEGSVNTLETPNTCDQAEGVSVRVIAAPSSVELLGFAVLGGRRRRDSPRRVSRGCSRPHSRYVYPSRPFS